MSRDIVDKPASQLFLFWGAGFRVLDLGVGRLFPVGLLIVAGCVDVVLGDDFSGRS